MNDQSFTLRPYRVPDDDVGTAALSAACNANPWTVADIEEWRRTFPADGIECDFVAVDANGDIVGHANAYRYPWAPPGQFALSVTVHPGARGRGLGKQLLGRVRDFAVRHGATTLTAIVPEDEPAEGSNAAEESIYLMQLLDQLDELGEGMKETALLVHAEGLSHAEAGAILGVTESTISWRVHTIRKQMNRQEIRQGSAS